VTALTLAAEVADAFDHASGRADELLDGALDAFVDPDGTVELAGHVLASGRQLDAIELVREVLLDEPEDEDAPADSARDADALRSIARGSRCLAVAVARRAGTRARRRDPAHGIGPRAEPDATRGGAPGVRARCPRHGASRQARSRSGATPGRAPDGPVVGATRPPAGSEGRVNPA
jgi:hypothetical protein